MLVRAAIDGDLICQQCHQQWNIANASAQLTHPIVADYATRAAAANAAATAAGEPQARYKTITGPDYLADNSLASGANGAIRLVNNGTTYGVSCTSCHGVHFADSDSASADTRGNYSGNVLSVGDGMLLRSDGATRANKSALCQACHNYRAHGDGGTIHSITGTPGVVATTTVGCLECHSGHSYNNGNVQFYVLRDQIGAPYNVTFTAPYDYALKPASHDQTTPWQDGVGANGYCEKCHGDASLLGGTQHTNTAKCMNCHFHNSSPAGYSFEPGANVAVCGDCHGFPPHLDARGDRSSDGNYEGGYAYVSDINDYQSAPNYKNEALTPHNAHAAAGVTYAADHPVVGKRNAPIGIDSDYRMGDSEVACSTCHGVRPSHDTGTPLVLGTYENIEFDSRASVTGQAAPAYDGAGRETCNNVYCHSNGGRRVGDNPTETTRAWSFIETPYTGGGTASGWKNGKGTLITALPALGSATECATCHGNTSATMTSRGNSAIHNKHLTAGYTCNVCHVYTATNNISVPKVARDVSKNAGDPTKGTHVNQKADVNFDPGVTPAIGSGTYAAAAGTCSVYCHSNGGTTFALLTYTSPDWDATPATTQCDFCHGNPPTSGSHARHITDASGPTLACAECHVNAGTYTAAGGHVDHLDGNVDTDFARCNTCHGIDGAETVPLWGQSATSSCKTCHTGGSTSTIEGRAAPVKALALTKGHGLPSGNYGLPTNKNAANRDCDACHDSAASGHFDLDVLDKRLIGGFDCSSCHNGTIAVQVLTHSNQQNSFPVHALKNPGIAAFTKVCLACHDPHGSSNAAMIYSTQATQNAKDPDGADPAKQFRGNVVFSSFTNADSFDEADAGVNAEDVCATCHTVTDHNRYNADVASHNQGTNCLGCHGHNGANGGFMPTGSSACNGCHLNPPLTGAHARHTLVASHDKDIEDLSDCAVCHPGADTYVYGASGTHQDLATTLANGISSDNCTSACHASVSAGDGSWSDANGLNCNACHGYPPAGNNHSKHITAGMTCSGCHVAVDTAGTSPLLHVDLGDTTAIGDDPATDALKIQHKGNAFVNVSGLDAELNDSAWNVGGGNSFVNGAGTTNNTCSNTLCHDPSNNGTAADWDSSTASCSLCHGAGTTMTTGSHGNHLNNAAVIGDNFVCTVCHPDNNVAGTDHTLTGGNVQGVVTIAGSKVNTYSGEVALPTSSYGTCTASQCHNDGKGANVASPAWGRAPQSADDCTICHGAPPTTGDHGNGSAGHWQPARTTLGLSCVSCHNGTAASNTTIKAGSLHLNGSSYNVSAGGNYNAVGVTISSYVQGSPSTCTASCHSANPKNWAAANSCEDCHAAKIAEPRHARHINVSPSIDADKTDCAQCHPNAGSYTIGGGHVDHAQTGGLTLNASIVNLGGGNYSCNTLCHLSDAVDGSWTDANGLKCDACHYYNATPNGAGNLAHAKVVSATHNEHFNKTKICTDCHGALENSGNPMVGPLTHITASGANQGSILAGKALASLNEANVTRTNMTWTDLGNTCANNGGGLALGCHANGTADWDLAINDCVSCHTDETTPGVNPTSGLHNFSSAIRHDDTLQTGACVNCHDATSPSSLHMNGTLNSSATATYTFNASKGITYVAANGCQANATCHTDGGNWKRKWGSATDAKPLATDSPGAAVCGNCHGDTVVGWRWNELNGTTTDHTDPNANATDNVTISHGSCQICHGWGAAGYNRTWLGSSNATYYGHGDGYITMNGPTPSTGSGYNNTNGGCDSQACHANDATHRLNTSSIWTANYGNYGAGTCSSCHGGGTVIGSGFNYWPDNATYPDKGGRHLTHITKLAARLGITLASATDLEQKRMCAYCHNDAAGVGGAGHSTDAVPTGVADVGDINAQWAAGDPPSPADVGSDFVEADGSCVSIDCHNNKTAPAGTYGWNNASTTACVMCHVDVTDGAVPASNGGTHVAHTGAAATFGRNITCDDCHKTAAETVAWGSPGTPPTNNHINGTFAVTGTVPFTYSASTCGLNNCHNNGKNVATPAYTWATPIAGCTACHGDTTATLTTQSHAVHTGSTIQTIACGQCHAAATAATHIDTNVTFGGSVTFTYGGDVAITGTTFGGCGTNNCHNNGKNVGPRTAVYTWGTTIATTCGECHGDTVATLTSQAHAAHLNASATYGRTIVCTDCHTPETNLTNHVNGTINIAGPTYSGDVAITGTTYGSCGTNACHENGLGGTPAQATYNWDTTIAGCSFCHNSAAMASGAHTTHVGTTNNWGPHPAGSTDCGECHLANANNTSMATRTTHLNGTNDFTGSTTLATTTVCNNCHGGATPAATAKTSWPAATRVTCQSCHGDYTLATAQVGGGANAPGNAGTTAGRYTLSGHGKAGIAIACTACHENALAAGAGHIDGTTGNAKRLKTVNSQTYGARYAAASIDFCGLACHATSMKLHYTNGASGTSFPANGALDCMTCHNPHGQTLDVTSNALATMIRPTIDGKNIVGFYNKATQNNYFVDPPNNAGNNRYGICQACHDPADSSASGSTIGNFNRTIATPGHQGSQLCTGCHKHTDTPAFQASGGGCNGCHGYPPVQRLTGAGAAYTYAKVEDYPGGGRAHAVLAHINPATLPDPALNDWTPCAPCHTETDHNTALGVANLQTNRDNSLLWSNEATRYPRVNVSATYDKTPATGFYNMGNRATAAVGMGNCSNTSCHFIESPKWDCLPADTTNDPQ